MQGVLSWDGPDNADAVLLRGDFLTSLWSDEASIPSDIASSSWTDLNTPSASKFYRIELQ